MITNETQCLSQLVEVDFSGDESLRLGGRKHHPSIGAGKIEWFIGMPQQSHCLAKPRHRLLSKANIF